MGAPVDITSQTFNRLTGIRYVRSTGSGRVWLFQCQCGNQVEAPVSRVRFGRTRSCGCLQKEKAAKSAARARAAKANATPPLEERFWAKVDKRGNNDCWPWLAARRRKDEEYGAFRFRNRQDCAHRVAWILTHGDIPAGLHVCHRCDNPSCVNPEHLFLGTNRDNNDDKVQKKRHAFGERIGTAKLTEADAREIVSNKPAGRCPRGLRAKLAKRFSVSPATISDVWSRRWNHL